MEAKYLLERFKHLSSQGVQSLHTQQSHQLQQQQPLQVQMNVARAQTPPRLISNNILCVYPKAVKFNRE